MSYISDFLASDGSEDAYRDYKIAASRENARDRWEREQDELVIDDGYDGYDESEVTGEDD